MPKITYIEHDGSQHTVEAEIGSTVMETALRNDIASIVAECGGSCTCATCLVHVDEKVSWSARPRRGKTARCCVQEPPRASPARSR
jgi:2Fe-2S ferredoxin